MVKHWIDERSAEVKANEQRRGLIAREATNIFASLWRLVQEDIKHAEKTLNTSIDITDNQFEHELRIPQPIQPGRTHSEAKILKIALKRDKSAVVVSGAIHANFDLDVIDGTICLINKQSNRVEYAEASRIILEPLLFPKMESNPDLSEEQTTRSRFDI